MFPILQLGPLAIQTPGLLLLVSIWIGLTLAEKRAPWHNLHAETLDNLVLAALAGFVAGGRLVYAGLNFSSFLASPLDIFSLNYLLFDLVGGLGAALLVAMILGQRKGLSLWPTLDALTPFFATLAVGLGAAHLASGAAFGAETSLPWGIQLHGATRHPSQVYEIAAALFVLNLVALRKPFEIPGRRFLTWAAWTAGAALFLEAFRGDSVIVLDGLRLGQIAAWIMLAIALIALERLQERREDG
ncbi:MAG: prolipoprotein diacylglyceryl transferase family protein [Chloroflexota bacterium]